MCTSAVCMYPCRDGASAYTVVPKLLLIMGRQRVVEATVVCTSAACMYPCRKGVVCGLDNYLPTCECIHRSTKAAVDNGGGGGG